MFADKLQNPFLKPSPFASSATYVPSYTPSYNLPPFQSSAKYNSFKPYEETNPISYQPSSYQAPLSYNSRQNQVKDIDTMLINNPFNRKLSNFGGSRTSDLSPNKYSNQALSYGRPKNSINYDSYQFSGQNYDYSNTSKKAYPESQRLTPTKKYDNYLSTSSADSAATYINKVTDLDQQRASAHDSKPLPENPFFRKNLLQRNIESEKPAASNYESSALKYMSYKMQSKRDLSPAKIESNEAYFQPYTEDEFQNRGAGYQNKYQTTFSKDKTLGYDQQKPTKFGVKQEKYGDYKYSFKKDEIPLYDLDAYDSKFNNDKYELKKESEYEKYSYPSNQAHYQKQQISNYEKSKPSQTYSKYMDQQKVNPYSYNDSARFGSKKDSFKKETSYQEPRVKFDQDEEAESSKFKSYKGIESFDSLGANPYAAYKGQIKNSLKMEHVQTYDYQKPYGQLYKLASSQVDEYTGPKQMEKKIKQNKYQQLGLDKPPQNFKKQPSNPFTKNQQESGYNKVGKAKAPTRDSSQYPKVLELKGVVFHKIEVA